MSTLFLVFLAFRIDSLKFTSKLIHFEIIELTMEAGRFDDADEDDTRPIIPQAIGTKPKVVSISDLRV